MICRHRFLSLIFFLTACSAAPGADSVALEVPAGSKLISIETTAEKINVVAETADTDEKRSLGLMHRKTLGETSGMLFVFKDESMRAFWMKDTPLSLDMIFILANGEIAYIARDTTPFSEASISPPTPAKWVLEVNAGFSRRHGVNVGDKIRF